MLSLKMGNDNDFTIYVLMLAKKNYCETYSNRASKLDW